MNPAYILRDSTSIFSPGLLFYKELICRNIARAVEIVGDPRRLRPHVKTHKTREIVRLQMEAGILKHKCATLAEAEMLASCNAPDVLLAYNPVGPNCERMARLAQAFPDCRFSVLTDSPGPLRRLSAALVAVAHELDVLIDINSGQNRTGIAPGSDAVALYELIARLPGLRPGGIHAYDGHNNQESSTDRQTAVTGNLQIVLSFRDVLLKKGLAVPRVVFGGTPTFPLYAKLDMPEVECSPGTCFLHDCGYGARFPDLTGFTPAALLLTRVVSRPTRSRVTFDLGTKAVASDPPAGQRCQLLDVPDYLPVIHNEEHFAIETPAADRFQPGDEVLAIPTHICPTCALHRSASIVEDGRVTGTWDIVARDRQLQY